MQDSTVALNSTLTLLEYGTCQDPIQAELLYLHREKLKPYLSKGWLKRNFDTSGNPTIQACGYVGLFPFNVDGHSRLLMVAPKGCQNDEHLGLLRFLELLAVSEGGSIPEDLSEGQGVRGPHQFLLLIAQHYAHTLTELCKRDFRLYYRAEEDDLRSVIRGRLDVSEYASRVARGRSHILPCRWDEFTVDNWDNRILWGAAKRLKMVASAFDSEAGRLIWKPFQPLHSWFSPVADITISSGHFQQSRLGRSSRYYRDSLAWARMLLLGSDLPVPGGCVAPIVLNAPAAFEKFTEAVVRAAIPDSPWCPLFQNVQPFLRGGQGQGRKPDILVRHSGRACAVGDAKYKDVLESDGNAPLESAEGILKACIKEVDWNQLYVYMRLTGSSAGFFILPFWNATGPRVYWKEDFHFEVSPIDRRVQVAVLGLNLLQPLREVKQEGSKKLREWLMREVP